MHQRGSAAALQLGRSSAPAGTSWAAAAGDSDDFLIRPTRTRTRRDLLRREAFGVKLESRTESDRVKALVAMRTDGCRRTAGAGSSLRRHRQNEDAATAEADVTLPARFYEQDGSLIKLVRRCSAPGIRRRSARLRADGRGRTHLTPRRVRPEDARRRIPTLRKVGGAERVSFEQLPEDGIVLEALLAEWPAAPRAAASRGSLHSRAAATPPE